MTDPATARFALPLLAAGQAQKEMTHNEALALLDIVVAARALSADLPSPPSDPQPGECWIVADSPGGDWAGEAGSLAAWTDGGWRFVRPVAGWTLWVEDRAAHALYDGGDWTIGALRGDSLVLDGVAVLGAAVPAIAAPVGGGTVDAEARAAISLLIAALQHHKLAL